MLKLTTEVCILDVKDFKTVMPPDLYYINQVSINETVGGLKVTDQIDDLKTLLAETVATVVSNKNTIANNILDLVDGTTSSSLSSNDLKDASNLQKASDQTLNEINARLQVLEGLI